MLLQIQLSKTASPTIAMLKDKKKVKRMLSRYENIIIPNNTTNHKKDVIINKARLCIPEIITSDIEREEDEKAKDL